MTVMVRIVAPTQCRINPSRNREREEREEEEEWEVNANDLTAEKD
jgi:hypothetical protein